MIFRKKENKERSLIRPKESGYKIYRRFTVRTAIFTLAVIILSGLYLSLTWNRYQNDISSEFISLAKSMQVVLPNEHIIEIAGNAGDFDNTEYEAIKNSLIKLVDTNKEISFAYILTRQDNKIIILMDSETAGSPEYSPRGQIYSEADKSFYEAFTTGSPVITGPVTDRWGTWISVLVPIKDSETGAVTALFGLDFSAAEWNTKQWIHMIPDIITTICILTLSFALSSAISQHFKAKNLADKLASDESLYHSVFDQAPVGIAIVHDKNFVFTSEFGDMNMNSMYEKILGRSRLELKNIKWTEITHPDDLQTDLENFELFKSGKINGYSMEKRFILPDGSAVWTIMKVSPMDENDKSRSKHLCLLEDITERKQTETELKESERRQAVLLSHLPGLAYRCNYDHEWTMQFVSNGCYNLTGYKPDMLIGNKMLSYNELISPDYRELLWNEWGRVLAAK